MSRFHPLRVAEVIKETPDCVSIAFELDESQKEDVEEDLENWAYDGEEIGVVDEQMLPDKIDMLKHDTNLARKLYKLKQHDVAQSVPLPTWASSRISGRKTYTYFVYAQIARLHIAFVEH